MVDPDRTLAVEDRAGEVEGAGGATVRRHGGDHLGHVRVHPVAGIRFGDHDGGDVGFRTFGQKTRAGLDGFGGDEGDVALQVDDHVMAAVGIQYPEGGQDPVRAGWQVGIGEDGPAPGGLDGRDDLGVARRHGHRPDA